MKHINLLQDFFNWLTIKNYKPRGIEEKMREAKIAKHEPTLAEAIKELDGIMEKK